MYAVNLQSRLASRVLMRLTSFSATSFPALARELSETEWELYLPENPLLRVRASLAKSRLSHTKAVEERTLAAVQERLGTPPDDGARTEEEQTLYIRAEKDRFTVSLDTSGALLHRRGIKTRSGPAPLRETLAAAVLAFMGYTGDETLLDPMCGSGAFSLEAAMSVCRVPPGWFRRFAFEFWPGFEEGRWRHARREAEQRIREPGEPCVFASDLDGEACAALADAAARHGLGAALTARREDFFAGGPGFLSGGRAKGPGFVALNPPYGLRLGEEEEARELYRRIGAHLRKEYAGWRAGVLAPARDWAGALPLKGATLHPLFHGGLSVWLACGVAG
jgi:putative N6-adenine-specific DNA methylase